MITRFYIHVQLSVDDKEDLSYYKDQPDRMVEEFKKMKSTKKKAEQFAIEAKQSAQKVHISLSMDVCVTSIFLPYRPQLSLAMSKRIYFARSIARS